MSQETKKQRVTKADLIRSFAAERGRSLRESKEDVETLLKLIKTEAWENKIVLLSGFGKFVVRPFGGFERKGEMVRNSHRLCFSASANQRQVEETL